MSTKIDDQDPSVTHTGSWRPGGQEREYKGTVSSSLKVGDSLTVPFTGTSITVIGTFDSLSAGVQTSYSIDGATAEVVTHKSASGDTLGATFWKSGKLTSGPHSLKVTMVKVNPSPDGVEGTVWFDAFEVVNDASSSSSSPPPPPSNTSTPVKNASRSTAPSPASASASSSQTAMVESGSKKPPTGPIVGGVIAALLILLGLTALFLFYRNRKRRSRLADLVEKPAYGSLPPSLPPPKAAEYPFSSAAPWAAPNAANAAAGGAAGAAFLNQQRPPPPHHADPAPVGAPYGGGPVHLSYNPYATAPPQGAANPYGALPPRVGYPPRHNPTLSMSTNTSLTSSSGPSTLFSGPASVSGYTPSQTSATTKAAAADSIGRLFIANDEPPAAGPAKASFDDSIAALKKRQQEVIDGYHAGIAAGSSSADVVQHLDSGIRNIDSKPVELPPVYTPA